MTDTITLTGVVATIPRHLIAGSGLPITSFRLACTQRRYDRAQAKWVDADTNWYTVSTFRQLAVNAVNSVHKGERVVVTGRLRIRDWQAGEKSGTTVEIEADGLGHDLAWGTARWARTTTTTSTAGAEPAGAEDRSDDRFPATGDDVRRHEDSPEGQPSASDETPAALLVGSTTDEREQVLADELATPF